MGDTLRVLIADDERPARSFLAALLRNFSDVTIVAEAANGVEAMGAIEKTRPDLALLDLQMPELNGLDVARLAGTEDLPLFAFVTAYDEYAVRAFELNAVDYLLKPVSRARLRQTLNRVHDRLDRAQISAEVDRVRAAAAEYEQSCRPPYLERVPIRRRDEITLLPVDQIASIVAERELLHIITVRNERHLINYRLKDLELRLDPQRFIRLGRGTLANVEMVSRITLMPGGTYVVTLTNGQQLPVSRTQSRIVRQQLLKL